MRIPLTITLPLILGLVTCKSDPTPHLYASQGHAPSLTEADITDLEHLGATLSDQGLNFGVYSERAERVELLLFDNPEDSLPVQRFEMERYGDVWNIYVEGVGYGQHYGFVAWGPNWPYQEDFSPGSLKGFVADVDSEGNRFNPNKLLFDPYGRVLHREHDWLRASLGTGESRRSESTWGAASKSMVARSDYEWSENEAIWREEIAEHRRQLHAATRVKVTSILRSAT